jgi:hypothetical protein
MAKETISTKLEGISVKPIPDSGLLDLCVMSSKMQIAVELTVDQAIELGQLLIACAAEARRNG